MFLAWRGKVFRITKQAESQIVEKHHCETGSSGAASFIQLADTQTSSGVFPAATFVLKVHAQF